jgi:type IV pilus assembly protein PilN
MIRINLLTVERQRTKKKAAVSFSFGSAQKVTVACAFILTVTAAYIGWRFISLTRESEQIDEAIGQAQTEAGRLHSIMVQVQQFEQRKGQLSQRVTLIEQLRKGQTGPVHMLDQISRSLPPMLWLTELKQVGGGEVVVDGRCTTLTSLSDFVANLEATGYFKKSIEIVSSSTEALAAPMTGELIKFSIKAVFQPPSATPAAGVPAAVAAVRQAAPQSR